MDVRAARHAQRSLHPPAPDGPAEASAEVPPDVPGERYTDAELDAMTARGIGMAAAAAALRSIADPAARDAVMADAHALVALLGTRYVAAVEEITAAYHRGQALGGPAERLRARREADGRAARQAVAIAKAATGHVL